MNSTAIKHLLNNPAAMVKYQRTGQLPSGQRPQSPLITLLEAVGPRALGHIEGVTVDFRLGYDGSRTFANAAQALRWCKPGIEMFHSYPAESWRIKGFTKVLTIEDLQACARIMDALRGR